MNKRTSFITKMCVIALMVFVTAQGGYAQDTSAFSLKQAQEYALEHSYLSQSAQLDIEKAERKRKETIAIGLPQVNGEANYQNYIQQPVQLVPGEFFGLPEGEFAEVSFVTAQQMSFGATANQLIFDGSYIVGLQASRVYLQLSQNDKVKSEIEIKTEVAKAYAQVLIAERNVSILKENLKNLERSAFETSEMFKSGFVEEQDAEQLELLAANIQNSYDNAVRQVQISKNLLKFQMGKPIAEPMVLSEDLESVMESSIPEGFLDKDFDIQQHIDYRIVMAQEEASELLWKREKTAYLPRLSAFYNYQRNSFSDEFNFFGGSRWFPTQMWGLNLSMPLFTSLSRNQKVQQAKLDLYKVQVAKNQISESLLLNVENSRSEYAFALNQYQIKERNMDLAQSIYNKTKIKYDEGINSSLELTQANNQLLEAQGEFISASFQLINAKVNLDQALNNY